MNLLKEKHSYRKILSMATSYKAKENSWDARRLKNSGQQRQPSAEQRTACRTQESMCLSVTPAPELEHTKSPTQQQDKSWMAKNGNKEFFPSYMCGDRSRRVCTVWEVHLCKHV